MSNVYTKNSKSDYSVVFLPLALPKVTNLSEKHVEDLEWD
jgi:hypothetical protein